MKYTEDTMQPLASSTTIVNTHPFERARDALWTLRGLRHKLSRAEQETLAILIDQEAMETIAESQVQAERGEFHTLEEVVTTQA